MKRSTRQLAWQWVLMGALLMGGGATSAWAQNTFPASGNVGIGTTTPLATLNIVGPVGGGVDTGAGELRLKNLAGSTSEYGLTVGARGLSNNGLGIYDYTNSLYRNRALELRIVSDYRDISISHRQSTQATQWAEEILQHVKERVHHG